MNDARHGVPPVRIGVLVPAGNTVHAREFEELHPPGVEFLFRGFEYPRVGREHFCAALVDGMATQLGEMRAAGVAVVLVGCTTASMVCADPEYVTRMERMAGVPVVTAATASRDALAVLGAKRVAVATPYGEGGNSIVSKFLREAGFEIAGIGGLGLDASVELWLRESPGVTADRMLEVARSANGANADAVYFPCTGVPSLESIRRCESEWGVPATSSVHAGLWASLRACGICSNPNAPGGLFERQRATAAENGSN